MEIGGYNIPAGCFIFSNLALVQLDSKNFTKPEQFNPERFICKNTGTYKQCYAEETINWIDKDNILCMIFVLRYFVRLKHLECNDQF